MILLVCYDPDEPGDNVLAVAKSQARAFSGVIHLVSSHPGEHMETAGRRKAEKVWAELEKVERGLSYAKSTFEDAGIPCHAHLSMRGLHAGEDLVLYAREYHVDTIVIGINKKSKFDKLLFGSTAQYVLLNAKCPVVAVP